MNPLDPSEFKIILAKINNDMPQHSQTKVKIKCSFSQQLPKNLMDFSSQINNKFLNDNLAIIEEIRNRNPKNIIPKWFVDYQVRNYQKYDILNHDNIFNSRLRDGLRSHVSPNLTEIREIGFFPYCSMATFSNPVLNRGGTNGSDLETGDTTSSDSGNANIIHADKLPSGTVGHLYNRIALNINVQAGNYRLGVYSDNSNPDTLYQQTGSLSVPATGFGTWETLTEFALSTAVNWCASTYDNNSCGQKAKSVSLGITEAQYQAATYGSLPSSWGATHTNVTRQFNMKIGHS